MMERTGQARCLETLADIVLRRVELWREGERSLREESIKLFFLLSSNIYNFGYKVSFPFFK